MRPHIEILNSHQLPWQVSEWLPGVQEKVLSRDEETGAMTTLLLFPPENVPVPGWTNTPTELFIVHGTLTIGKSTLKEGCYSFLPTGTGHRSLCSENSSLVLTMLDAYPLLAPFSQNALQQNQPITYQDTLELPWEAPAEGSAPGLVFKYLHKSEASQTFLVGAPPLWNEKSQETHLITEEAFMLRGDCLMGDRGTMHAGDYFYRPPHIPHGPLLTRTGGLWLFRNGGDIGDIALTRTLANVQLMYDYLMAEPVFDF